MTDVAAVLVSLGFCLALAAITYTIVDHIMRKRGL